MPTIPLRAKLLLVLAGLTLTILSGSGITLWYTHQVDTTWSPTVSRDIESFQAAEELLAALVMQKGFVTYYFLKNDQEWLDKLHTHHETFMSWIQRARDTDQGREAHAILNEIETRYLRYAYARDQVITLYKKGLREQGAELHWLVREQFFTLADLCRKYKELHRASISATMAELNDRQQATTRTATALLICSLILAGLLGFLIFERVLKPIRRLIRETESPLRLDRFEDEISSLTLRMHQLVNNVDQTRTKLQESREHLQQKEKLATVGKLAAGVAHSVRNPLTSVKMRLFSLQRSLALSPIQKEDFEVIAEEIRHIDTILSNFLEFSRRPKLRTQPCNPSEIVTGALQLMHHRLKSYGIEIRRETAPLQDSLLDPEQLKEVLVNLLENSCEAMPEGGTITIEEQSGVAQPLGHISLIRLIDTGPGIPEEVRTKVFDPFFSTKEEGTGLGLSIARRIVEDHGGWLNVSSKEGRGTTFSISLPAAPAPDRSGGTP